MKEKEPRQRRRPGRVPCEKCVSRGCEAICPDGSLTAGKGNRLVLSGTEELHERISSLCSRIRDLEEALASVQAKVSQEPHPLLRSDLLQLKAPHHQSSQGPPNNAHDQADGAGGRGAVIIVNGDGRSLEGSNNTTVDSSITSSSGGLTVNGNRSESGFPNGDRHPHKAGVGDENFIDAFGTLSLDLNGESNFLGKTARSEYLIRALSKPTSNSYPSSFSSACVRLPKKIIQFPSTCLSEDQQLDLEGYDDIGEEIFALLPDMSEAFRLCDVYLEAGKYMYTPIPRKELLDEILTGVYRAGSFSSLPQKHTLALVFIIFALAALFDPNKPPYSLDAQEYFYLARAARNHTMSFSSAVGGVGIGPDPSGNDDEDDEKEEGEEENADRVGRRSRSDLGYGRGGSSRVNGGDHGMGRRAGFGRVVARRGIASKTRGGWGMSVTGLWTTIHMSQYLEFSDWEALGSSSAWWFVGFSLRLATSLGLHLNSARWKVPEEVQKKRALVFWQIFTVDTWLSFHYGRPPSLSRVYIDCPLPEDPEEYVGEDGKKEIGFHSWTFQYTYFMHNVIETAFGCNSPPYSLIIDIDRQIRDFPVPQHLRPRCRLETVEESMAKGGKERVCAAHTLTMQRWMTLSYKESTLLNLHRPYFAQALQDSPDDLASHKYLPSVMATYRSAWRLIEALKLFWIAIPQMLERYNLAWSHALSAAIVMCILVTRAPNSKMTKSSLKELDAIVELYEDASARCKSAANILETVRNLRQKAHEAVDHTQHLSELPSSNLSTDELDRLGGRTHLISSSSRSSKRHSKASMCSSRPSSNSTSPSCSNYETPLSQGAGSSPTAGPSSHSNHDSPTDSFAPQPQPTIPPPSNSTQNSADNLSLLQELFTTENMHPIIAHDLQELNIISGPRLSTGPGPWPLFYDLPTGIPGSGQGPPTLPVPNPGSGSRSGPSRNPGANAMGADLILSSSRAANPRTSGSPPTSSMDWPIPTHTQAVPPSLSDWPFNPFYDPSPQSPLTMSGFPTGGFGGLSMNPISGSSPPILDATWQSFVEQLGF
ncbi:hypothetical protein K435DRAFT_828690 [Dendrothele bispora CBS 962.96]|uniref:Xylanolytic transcriptional activator regulatory domain-containing protein n=1 Tax=Dendrothele bispora (strain CBS 962.96) TaxID=1314807 RepID=A0A4S8M5Y1_DENBC|nr:hypothetical protein K435DRAFT_828690 [Dendrothele bispora CBS 962.96]